MKENAFEYIVYLLVKKYLTENKLEISQFNSNNNFSREKVLLLPFFVTIGNGSKKELLTLFNKFKPVSYGIIDSDIEESIRFEFTDYSLSLPINFNIDSRLIELNTELVKGPNYMRKIENSISHLYFKFQNFASLDFNILSFWSTNNISWEVFYNMFETETNKTNTDLTEVRNLFNEMLSLEEFLLSPTQLGDVA